MNIRKRSDTMENLIDKKFTYAIIGASNNTEKYGYKVLKDLTDAGYTTIPINPKEETIYGKQVIHSIAELNNADVLILVVPPKVSIEILQQANMKGFKKVWFQPGSSNEDTKKFCEEHDFSFVDNMCIMIQKNN